MKLWPWTLRFGVRGEQLAERHLRRSGLSTIARRYRTPVGELDLVMRDHDTIVFVEVKTRRDDYFADPEDAVTRAKQRKLLKAAAWYLRRRRLEDRPCRFDIVTVLAPPDAPDSPTITHIPDAFLPDR